MAILNTAEIILGLQQATVDLLWVSESDYPFEVVTWDKGIELTPLALFKAEGAIESILLTDFFAPALIVEDWYEADELATVDRYKLLLQLIESNLIDLKVFRIGSIEVDVYIVGKTSDSDIVGLKTTIVET
jgi:Nuclease A inhibitor-like protein